MPKESKGRSGRSSLQARSRRPSPYACAMRVGSSYRSSTTTTPPTTITKGMKEEEYWDEVRCPVCMEPPHNAVLLLCASRDKGCRPFMCDTSHRHSNCFHQYKKAFSERMSCPLCRGEVTGCVAVAKSARGYMNSKVRGCSKESCGFSGSYEELRRHARKEHPLARPSEADPGRQRDWRRMEEEVHLGDVLSAMESDDDVGVVEEDEEEMHLEDVIASAIEYALGEDEDDVGVEEEDEEEMHLEDVIARAIESALGEDGQEFSETSSHVSIIVDLDR